MALTSRNVEDVIDLSADQMTKKQLIDKCKDMGISSAGSNIAVLVKRINEVSIEGVRGFSKDKYLCVALSMKQTREVTDLASKTNNYETLFPHNLSGVEVEITT